MSTVITMEEFKESRKDAVNLTEEEKKKVEMDEAMVEAQEIMYAVEDRLDGNSTALYFLWCEMTTTLLEHCSWTARELSRDVRDAAKSLKEEEEDRQ